MIAKKIMLCARVKSILILPIALGAMNNAFAAPPANYYNSVDQSSAAALRSSLHNVIDDHKRFPYTSSSTDTWDILERADQDETNSSNVTTIYRNISYVKQGGGNSLYNREHSWPKSYGFPDDNSRNYPYTDTHHLFAADIGYNSSRSNHYFDNCSPSCSEKATTANDGHGGQGGGYPGDSNWVDSNSWEVWKDRRGDIARAMFYMDLRYEGGSHGVTGASEPDLRLTDNTSLISNSRTGNNESVAYMGLLSTLLEWHEQDPVDADERERNDVIFSFQGNRSPFVDNPEWVDCIYRNQCDGSTGGGGSGNGNGGGQQTDVFGSEGRWRNYNISIPAGTSRFEVKMSGGTGDADLYVRRNALPTVSTYDCRPYLAGNQETCTFNNPQAGTWHISIRGYTSYSGVDLEYNYFD